MIIKFLTTYFILLFFVSGPLRSQQDTTFYLLLSEEEADSFQFALKQEPDDLIRLHMYRQLGAYYQEIDRELALSYFQQALELAEKQFLPLWKADAYSYMGYLYSALGNYPSSLNSLITAQSILDEEAAKGNNSESITLRSGKDFAIKRETVWGVNHLRFGFLYGLLGDTENRLKYLQEGTRIAKENEDLGLLGMTHLNLGWTYLELGELDTALTYEMKSIRFLEESGYQSYIGMSLSLVGTIHRLKGNFTEARNYYKKAIQAALKQQNIAYLGIPFNGLAGLFQEFGNLDSSLYFAKKALSTYQKVDEPRYLQDVYITLASIYKQRNQLDSAFYFQTEAMILKDSLYNSDKIRLFENVGFNEKLRVQELERERIENRNRIRTYSLLAGILVSMIIAYLLYRNNRQRQRANQLLQSQKDEIQTQKELVEEALKNLKLTQAQLIHSEKMASLGELTAGIAHEIQNPLNFVNNFSDLNAELIEELKAETKAGNMKEVDAILNDISENEQKIHHHGRRAEGIVRSMLQHSRTGSGEKQLTDINALCEEYLPLAYHGMRAKDKSFNAQFETDLDPNLPKIEVIPQDIGRVLLNLINNAFQACSSGGNERPRLWLKSEYWTKSESAFAPSIKISISDNGPGIPSHIKDKIFQPFFTTKPTGQGTGLGLSLSYDIVKAHGGDITVKTEEGEGSTFIVSLPVD